MKFDKAVAGLLLLVPAVVYVGWITGSAYLKSMIPGFSPMNPVTATLFLLVGIAFVLHIVRHRYARLALRVVGWAALFVGTTMLLKYLAGVDMRIDGCCFRGVWGQTVWLPTQR